MPDVEDIDAQGTLFPTSPNRGAKSCKHKHTIKLPPEILNDLIEEAELCEACGEVLVRLAYSAA